MSTTLRQVLFGKPRNSSDEDLASGCLKTGEQKNPDTEQVTKKQKITLPHKALPETLGRVFQLSPPKDTGDTRDGGFTQYLLLTAHDLMYTNIAVEEAGYPSQPSVLIIEPDYYSYYRHGLYENNYRNDIYDNETYKEIQKQRDSFTNKNFRPYGTQKLSSLLKFTDVNSPGFSEMRLLGDIQVNTDTGIHSLYVKSRASKQTWFETISSARKFFDIILIGTLSPTLSRDFIMNISIGYQNQNYSSTKLAEESVAYCETVEDFNEVKIFSGPEAKTHLLAPSNTTFSVMRILTHDFIRHLLEVENPVQSINNKTNPFFKKVNGWSKKIVSNFFNPSGLTVAFFLPFSVGYVALATIIGLFLEHYGLGHLLFLLGIGPAIAAFFCGRLISAGIVRGVANLIQKRNLKRIKVVLKQMKPKYSYIPLAGSAIMESIDKKRFLTETVERVDLGTVVTEAELLPLDVLRIRIDELKDRWMSYELDPVKALEYPMLLDASIPSTSAFLTVYQELESYERQFQDDPSKAGLLAKTLSKTEEAFIIAENAAKKSRLSHLNNDHKKRIKSAKPLVAIAASESSSPTERMGAWKRANDLLEGVLALPEASVVGLLEGTKKVA